MDENLTAEEREAVLDELNAVVSAVLNRLIAIADKRNVVRDDLIRCWGKLFSTMAEISTFKNFMCSAQNQDLCDESTSSLVNELKNRDGVETYIAEPYADVEVKVNGPAVVLVVID